MIDGFRFGLTLNKWLRTYRSSYRLIYRYKNIDTYNVLAILGSLICIALLGIPLLISFLLPNIFSYIGVVIGLLIIKVKLIIEAFIKK